MATVPPPVDLNAEIEGPPDAPVLVLSHALGLSMGMWDAVRPHLSSLRVLRYDDRGHGASPVPPGPYAISDLGQDLIRLLDRLGMERVSFCGLSLGGMVGQWLGAHAPDRLHQLLLCCTAPRMMHPEDYAARAVLVRREGMAPIAETVLSRWFTPAFLAGAPEPVESIRGALLATPVEGYAATCEALAAMDLRDDLPRIAVPTLVVAGENDQATPPEQSREMSGRIPHAQLVVIPGAPHLASVEQPEAVAEQILRWVLSPTS
ncbi:MAG: 3-oxoadipate enol-lactonase [Candidatus Dormibacter sp.]